MQMNLGKINRVDYFQNKCMLCFMSSQRCITALLFALQLQY